jgi:hypothetical protein
VPDSPYETKETIALAVVSLQDLARGRQAPVEF